MFNGSVLNGASFNGGSGGVRVLLASAILTVSMASSAEPLHIHKGSSDLVAEAQVTSFPRLAERANADFTAQSKFENPWNSVLRRARTDSILGAGLSVDRPIDLILSNPVFPLESKMEAQGYADRSGISTFLIDSGFEANSIVHSFFASFKAVSSLDVDNVVLRFGDSVVTPASVLDATGTRIRNAKSEGSTLTDLRVDSEVFAGGVTVATAYSFLHAEPHLNGIQLGEVDGTVSASTSVNGDRIAGGHVNAEVVSKFNGEPLPGRSIGKFYLDVDSGLYASWFRYTFETADIYTHSKLDSEATRIHQGDVDFISSAGIYPEWSRIVEPQPVVFEGEADLEANPWRIRQNSAEGTVISKVSVDDRVALRGNAELFVKGNLTVNDRLAKRGNVKLNVLGKLNLTITRTAFGDAKFIAIGSVIRNRASVNLTLNAPDTRSLLIKPDNRVMSVPYEYRTMRVI